MSPTYCDRSALSTGFRSFGRQTGRFNDVWLAMGDEKEREERAGHRRHEVRLLGSGWPQPNSGGGGAPGVWSIARGSWPGGALPSAMLAACGVRCGTRQNKFPMHFVTGQPDPQNTPVIGQPRSVASTNPSRRAASSKATAWQTVRRNCLQGGNTMQKKID